MAGEAKKLFAASEVALHASRKDCWVIIGGKVYDVTKFLEDTLGERMCSSMHQPLGMPRKHLKRWDTALQLSA
ncbi:hypothetical protein BDA96_08G082400 [Sorghum bicolor]|uniref:Cytochrome b5 heme-binding domain-containing protein n=1 Tax=Sorghum bicolor TaxID=4558 RepID=A0A921QEV5_SORBI|nr:hypothetical protein BDA96_08G082400 [Sorghum bicolor]